jgi:putative lipid kinase YegS-like protein
VTIAKGQPWGSPGSLPEDGVIVGSDREARAVVEHARRAGLPIPALGLVGGDLCRTLGGTGDRDRLRSPEAVTFPLDVGTVVADGRRLWFVAHLVARDRWARRWFVVMNAQWWGRWNLGPRAHPDDGLLDVYEASLRPGEVWRVRARLKYGAHLPHPHVTERRAPNAEAGWERPRQLWLDGAAEGPARVLAVGVEPDALTVVV